MSKIINGVASEYDMPTSRCKTLEDLVNNYETGLKYHNYEFDELSYKLLIIDLKKILQENQQLKSDLLKEEISYNNLRESYNLECDRNKKLVSRIENDEEDIRHLLDIINHNCNELKCNSDEWLVLKGWQDRLKEGNNENNQ